jgi:hypothetical protein
MGLRAMQPSQDFRKMCEQAERDHESRKLIVLIERVKHQLAERKDGARTDLPRKPSVSVLVPSRTAIFER